MCRDREGNGMKKALPVRFDDDEREALERFKAERRLASLNQAVRVLVREGTGLEQRTKRKRRTS
jgi:hypothetical protein